MPVTLQFLKTQTLIAVSKSAASAIHLLLTFLICDFILTGETASSTMMQAAQYEIGGPEKLSVGQVAIPSLREREVLIRVHATAINRAETLQRQGKYPPVPGESEILGLEAAGVVEKLGPGASKWKIGDRVMALLPGGGNAEFVAAFEDHLIPVPITLPFTQAAAIPEVWLTAYQLLHFVGKLKVGEKVLIHAGASGVGTAAVQLVKQAQAQPYVTAGSKEKIQFAEELGAIKGFNYKEGDFAAKVLKATNGDGVDLILDCVGASHWEQNIESLKAEGRWVLYGSLGGVNVEGPILGKILRKRISLIGSTLKARSTQYKTELISAFSDHAMPLFANGTYRPIIYTIFLSLHHLPEAHRTMEANQNTGKIVLKVSESKEEL
ncbi:hypothetical protein CAPTEDRAFT_163551 [Capitella teleta]|uniref:Enoyl reductase (ER) domain-containing protein n=1 Tax=Capitella teleta TaxID=283909 RepID=R7T3E0_CAPTE|nr:hypothetical protein CAPTEDRAFT_163551 [Capitella teleta]|eukprot:ELT87242.1 hypothetical protein CAPTEDRAFT_163551 [Capitella teleta]